MAGVAPPLPSSPPDPTDIFGRWFIGENDAQAREIERRLSRTWRDWTLEQRLLLLWTAEAIARAQRAKASWNPKAERGPLRDALPVLKLALDAARLAEKITTAFPPPWAGARAPIGSFVAGLAEFIEATIDTTTTAQPGYRVAMAGHAVQMLRKQTPKYSGRVSWDLLADLAWLAGGGNGERLNESTIRRYGDYRSGRNAVAAHWTRHWALMIRVLRLAPARPRHRYDEALSVPRSP
jgi:hypothetical protein